MNEKDIIKLSVIKEKRSLSELEFYHNALKLDKELNQLLLKDFGIRDKVRELKYFCDIKKLDSEDKEMFLKIVEKYKMDENIIESYPLWLIDYYRKCILDDMQELFKNITEANSIYAINIQEWEERRRYQTKAIANVQNLSLTMNRIIHNLPVNANKMMRFVDMIATEDKLLRGWRKGGNKLLKKLKGVESTSPDTIDIASIKQ